MTPYLLVFTVFLAIYFALGMIASRDRFDQAGRYLLLAPLAIFTFIYAGHIGSDLISYSGIYDTAEILLLEPGFSILMMSAKSMGLGYDSFAKLVALAQFVLLVLVVKRLRDPSFFLLFYVSVFFLNFQFNVVRNSLALLILAAFYVRTQKLSMIALVSASIIHYSSLISLGFYWLAILRRQWLAMSIVLGLAIVIAVIQLYPDLVTGQLGDLFVYRDYLVRDYDSKTIYPALLLKLILSWFFFRNGGRPLYFKAYLVLVVLIHMSSPIFSRLSDMVLFLSVLDICARHRIRQHRRMMILLTLALMASSFLIPWSDCQSGGNDNWCLVDVNN
jgi:hypothetical protein